MINFLAQIKKGEVDGIKLRLDRLQVTIMELTSQQTHVHVVSFS